MKEWRELWPGGLDARSYSTLNRLGMCRGGGLGYNRARCGGCGGEEWFASSCGDRHCPNCLGPRQAQWSEQVCSRLPDCPHFHVVFTVPEEFGEFFEGNYKVAARALFSAAAETLRVFQRNNWKMAGGFFGVLHTWGSALNWHPHLHMLVSAGGTDAESGRWRQARGDYLFPVRSMSEVFGAIMLREIESLDGDGTLHWPEGLESVEARRDWRLRLARKNWNIFSRPTLGNTRAVVRYLARYTSRIAMSNHRIRRVDDRAKTVSFAWKDYRNGGRAAETTITGKEFIRRFSRHLVPKGLRRVRYFGLLAGKRNGFKQLPGAPVKNIAESPVEARRPRCKQCDSQDWEYGKFYSPRGEGGVSGPLSDWVPSPTLSYTRGGSLSLVLQRAGPREASNKTMKTDLPPPARLTLG